MMFARALFYICSSETCNEHKGLFSLEADQTEEAALVLESGRSSSNYIRTERQGYRFSCVGADPFGSDSLLNCPAAKLYKPSFWFFWGGSAKRTAARAGHGKSVSDWISLNPFAFSCS